MMTKGSWLDFMHKTSISQFQQTHTNTKKDNLLVFKAEEHVTAILKRLHERGLHSAPVFDEGKYLGFVDVRDVVTVLLMACSKGKTTEEIAWSDWETDFSRLQIAGQEFGMRCAADVCNASGNNPWIEVSGDGTFEQLCEELVAMKAHRCAIMSEKGALHSVVSASDVLQFIAEHASIWAPQIGERMVGDILDLKSAAAPITIPQDALAVQAFYLMHVQKVSAVGVIGPKGQLVANLSASDLKGIGIEEVFVPTTFRSLFLPIKLFLMRRSRHIKPPVVCNAYTSLETAVLQMALFRLHRLWVVDANNKPIAVLSAFDVMKQFIAKE